MFLLLFLSVLVCLSWPIFLSFTYSSDYNRCWILLTRTISDITSFFFCPFFAVFLCTAFFVFIYFWLCFWFSLSLLSFDFTLSFYSLHLLPCIISSFFPLFVTHLFLLLSLSLIYFFSSFCRLFFFVLYFPLVFSPSIDWETERLLLLSFINFLVFSVFLSLRLSVSLFGGLSSSYHTHNFCPFVDFLTACFYFFLFQITFRSDSYSYSLCLLLILRFLDFHESGHFWLYILLTYCVCVSS